MTRASDLGLRWINLTFLIGIFFTYCIAKGTSCFHSIISIFEGKPLGWHRRFKRQIKLPSFSGHGSCVVWVPKGFKSFQKTTTSLAQHSFPSTEELIITEKVSPALSKNTKQLFQNISGLYFRLKLENGYIPLDMCFLPGLLNFQNGFSCKSIP